MSREMHLQTLESTSMLTSDQCERAGQESVLWTRREELTSTPLASTCKQDTEETLCEHTDGH